MAIILNLYKQLIAKANLLSPIMLIIVRVVVAQIFFSSGLVKIRNFDTTIALFKEEYQVPIISPVFAAISGTFFELTCPILLVLGFATRLAALPLIAMTLVIQFTYDQNPQHYHWLIMLGILLTHGAGKLSLDNFIKLKFNK